MATNKYIVTSNDNDKYTLHEKRDKRTNEVYYEVYRYTEDETCGEYIEDFESTHPIGTDEFRKEFNDWLDEPITALF